MSYLQSQVRVHSLVFKKRLLSSLAKIKESGKSVEIKKRAAISI